LSQFQSKLSKFARVAGILKVTLLSCCCHLLGYSHKPWYSMYKAVDCRSLAAIGDNLSPVWTSHKISREGREEKGRRERAREGGKKEGKGGRGRKEE